MSLFKTEAEMRSALQALDPVASDAAREFCQLILNGPYSMDETMKNPKVQQHLFGQACSRACSRAGMSDMNVIRRFVQLHGEQISKVAISIACHTIDADARAQRKR